jgi:prolyl-tRNA synthetase
LLKDGQDADNLYHKLLENKFEVLYDDRANAGAGEKFADADLIGCPYRLVISKKTLLENGIEFKKRGEKDGVIVPIDKAIEFING